MPWVKYNLSTKFQGKKSFIFISPFSYFPDYFINICNEISWDFKSLSFRMEDRYLTCYIPSSILDLQNGIMEQKNYAVLKIQFAAK